MNLFGGHRCFPLAALLLIWDGVGVGAGAPPAPGSIPLSWGTAQKPQSKLWHDQGTWWAALPQEKGVCLWRLTQERFEPQPEPGPLKDSFPDCECDVLLTGKTLFVLAFRPAGEQSPLHAFQFANRAYHELPGYPVTLERPAKTATCTIDADSAGRLWAACLNDRQEVVARFLTTSRSGDGFSKPIVLAGPVTRGDTCALVAFKGRVGVMWSDSKQEQLGFRVHLDNKPADQWEPAEVAAAGKAVANDHLNLAADAAGNVWAVTKGASGINISFAQLTLRRRTPGGKWDQSIPLLPEAKGVNCTRPVVMLEAERQIAYALYTERASKPTVICLRRVSLADGKVGSEERILSADYDLNNATDCKATVNPATGLLVLAGAMQPKDGPARFRVLSLKP